MIVVSEDSIAKAWERALIELVMNPDIEIRTEYDRDGDPPSIDDVCIMEVTHPMSEPRIHKCFPGGWDDLVKYVDEVVHGSRDHLHSELSYTYHDRLVRYPISIVDTVVEELHDARIEFIDELDGVDEESVRDTRSWSRIEEGIVLRGVEHGNMTPPSIHVNQLDRVVELLRKCPYTRRAQAITWIPSEDLGSKEPPCLQSLQFRIVPRDGIDVLDMHVRFRSRDALHAAYMNMYALTELQSVISRELDVPIGHYVDMCDSFHIYGSRREMAEAYVNRMVSRDDNYYTTNEFRSLWEDGI